MRTKEEKQKLITKVDELREEGVTAREAVKQVGIPLWDYYNAHRKRTKTNYHYVKGERKVVKEPTVNITVKTLEVLLRGLR